MRKKTCLRCEIPKSLNEFHRNKKSKDGRSPYCKSCKNAIQKSWREKNPDKVEKDRERHKKNMRRRYKEDPEFREYTRRRSVAYKRSLPPEERKRRDRARYLKHTYGLTIEQFEELHGEQEGKCPICLQEQKLVVDHDHDTGDVRGLLCQCCNLALGQFGDSEARIRRAAHYLRQFKT